MYMCTGRGVPRTRGWSEIGGGGDGWEIVPRLGLSGPDAPPPPPLYGSSCGDVRRAGVEEEPRDESCVNLIVLRVPEVAVNAGLSLTFACCCSHVLYADRRCCLTWLPGTWGWRLTQGKVWASGTPLFHTLWQGTRHFRRLMLALRFIQNKMKLREMFASEISVTLEYALQAEQVKIKKNKKMPACGPVFIMTQPSCLITLNLDPVVFAVTLWQSATYIPWCWIKITVTCWPY